MKSGCEILRCLQALAVVLLLSACTIKDAVESLKPTPFITKPEQLAAPKFTPFDLAWIKPGAESRQYDRLLVQPVKTEYVDPQAWLFSASAFIPSSTVYLKKVSDLAEYIRQEVTEKFEAAASDSEVEVIEGPAITTLHSLLLEISIADVNFGDPVVYGGLLAVPLPGVANLSTAVKSPQITLEARFIDDLTREVVTEIIDRRFPQVKIVDVNRLTVSRAAHELADSFADDLVAAFFRKKGEKIGRRWPFSLVPW